MTRMLFVLMILAPCVASAGEYRFSGSRYPQKVFVPTQQFFYFVGQPVRVAALVEAEKRADPDYQRFLEWQRFRRQAAPLSPSPATTTDDDAPASNFSAVLARRCAACHGGAAPQGGLRLDGQAPLTAAQVTDAQRRVLRQEMPPAEPLSEVEIGEALQALLTLERTDP